MREVKLQHNANVNESCSPKCNRKICSTSMNMKTEVKDAGECPSSDAVSDPFGEFSTTKELCISVLKSHGLLGGGCTSSACPSEVVSSCDASPSKTCKICGQLDNLLKMLICDLCEEAFHPSCCTPKVKDLPDDIWYCKVCFKKRPKPSLQNSAENVNDAKFEKREEMGRDLDRILSMLKDTKPYTTGVRIGSKFQAEVPDWSGPSPIQNDYFGEPSEMHPTVSTFMNERDPNYSDNPKAFGFGNWIQCREVIGKRENDEDIVCGKWRRAPLSEVQTDDWDCSCAIPRDLVHADCAVPQELDVEEVRKHLQILNLVRPCSAEKKRKFNQN